MQKKSSKKSAKRKATRWSAEVTKQSDALDLRAKVFKLRSPHQIALSLKHSAQSSKRGKGTPYQIIGSPAYGKPVLDRTFKYSDPLQFALKVGVLAFDSTRISAAAIAAMVK